MAIVAVHTAPVEDTMRQSVDTVAKIANDQQGEAAVAVPSFDVNQDVVTESSVNATTAVEEEGDSSTALPNSSEEEDGSGSSEEVTVPSVDATTAVEQEVVV